MAGVRRTAVATSFWAWVRVAWLMAVVAAGPSWGMAAGTEDDGSYYDDSDCNRSVNSLVPCIPYVTGKAASPTPDCCAATLAVHLHDPRCFCMVVRSSFESDDQIHINLTLAFRLPALCHIDGASISKCPSILALPPDTADERFFDAVNSTAPAPSMSAGRRPECSSWGKAAALVVSAAWAGAEMKTSWW